jgi:hypothetical protein
MYRAFFHYRKPWDYCYGRFVLGPGILELPRPISNGIINNAYSIHILSGHRDLTMLLWSLASWYRAVGESGRVYIHDDGTFTGTDKQILGRLLPQATIVDCEEMGQKIVAALARSFPAAHHYRSLSFLDRRYIFNLKLIDPFFAGGADVKLILDSDLLWFLKPEELLRSISSNHLPVFMGGLGEMDFVFSDGSSLPKEISGINSGIVSYRRDQFNLKDLDEFYSHVDSRANPHFVEQAGYAYVLTRRSQPNFLPANKYQIKGPANPQTVMKHYTNPRREQFWFEGVKILAAKLL